MLKTLSYLTVANMHYKIWPIKKKKIKNLLCSYWFYTYLYKAFLRATEECVQS